MSAEHMLSTYSLPALRGAIDQLQSTGMWPSRLHQLRAEMKRRKIETQPKKPKP